MSLLTVSAKRGLRAPLHVTLLCLVLAACGAPSGSTSPAGPVTQAATPGGAVVTPVPGSSAEPDVPERSSGLTDVGGQQLVVTAFSVDEALSAEGGEPLAAMLDDLGVAPGDVQLSLAVAPGGDPAISDWFLPGASASDILAAWEAAAPGAWTPTSLGGVAALEGSGPDGAHAWALAVDERFVYVRTDDASLAGEVAAIIG